MMHEDIEGEGYQLEIKLPMSFVTKGINIEVVNVDDNVVNNFQLSENSMPVLYSPNRLTERFSEFGLYSGRRIWLLDKDGRVLVRTGSLENNTSLVPVNPLFAWFLTPQLISDPWEGKTRLERDDIQTALKGDNNSLKLAGRDGESMILSSAWPVKNDQQTIAVILIEESTASIQIMQRSALSELLNLSLFIFLLLSIALIGFAGRLGSRIRKLRDIADHSIDQHGRVRGEIPESREGDELDDLATHISEMLVRLQQYHDYLEKLASRLSHELRTPVAVVKSSLENIHHPELSENQVDSLKRADSGILRLQTILNRMGEASRLEQSIDDSNIETFESSEFLDMLTKGYQSAYPEFNFILNSEPKVIQASKDLLAQCMDKLIGNAVSFADTNSEIKIESSIEKNHWLLSVYNIGPSLPEGMEQQLFQSMVSVRQNKDSNNTPHLGLGLHIVRLIAEFHKAEVMAENWEKGVRFTFKLPLIKK